ncbi:MAG: guanylate kinase [Acidimicrobiales bacterium]
MTTFVLVGPGGAGKGTVAAALTARVPDLWLSRSWTTRPRRTGEADDAYVWVTPQEFRRRIEGGGFLEWAEYLGNLYGTPVPDPPAGSDVLLEIDLQGAEQVLARRPDAVVVLLLPPSAEVQRSRLVARGDSADHVERRLQRGREEVVRGREVARHVVVNADLEQAVGELAGIVNRARSTRGTRGKDLDGS